MSERLLTTTEAARALNVPASAISDWKARHRVTPAGMLRGRARGGHVPLYKLDELRPLAEAYRARLARRADNRSGE